MAKCKYCGQEISRLDKENCPFCGGRKPLEGVDDSTQDMTKAFESLSKEDIGIKQKSKMVAAILAFVLGIFGAHNFYLGKKKIALITILITVVFVAAIGLPLFFTILPNALAFVIPYLILEAVMVVVGINILTRHDISDANGEFLK